MKKSIIKVREIKKSYKDVEVLKGVDFEVEQGVYLHYWVLMEQEKQR